MKFRFDYAQSYKNIAPPEKIIVIGSSALQFNDHVNILNTKLKEVAMGVEYCGEFPCTKDITDTAIGKVRSKGNRAYTLSAKVPLFGLLKARFASFHKSTAPMERTGKNVSAGEARTVDILMPLLNSTEVYNNFGKYNDQIKSHTGNDMACGKGCAVVAVRAGTVINSFYDVNASGVGGGNIIEIRDREFPSLTFRYMHLSDRSIVKTGDSIEAGQLIAFSGDTGSAGSYHLHFEIPVSGEEKNLFLNVNNRNYSMEEKAFTQDAYIFRSSLSSGNRNFGSLEEMLQQITYHNAGYRVIYQKTNRLNTPPIIHCKVPNNLNSADTSWILRGVISSKGLLLSVKASIQNELGKDVVNPVYTAPSLRTNTYMYDMTRLDSLKFSSLKGQPGAYYFCVKVRSLGRKPLSFRHPFTVSDAAVSESLKQFR